MTVTKTCTKCCDEKPLSEFCVRKCAKDGLNPRCKMCETEYINAWRAINGDRERAVRAAYRAANSDKIDASIAAWRAANSARYKSRIKAAGAAWYGANRERRSAVSAAWAKANLERRRVYAHNRRAFEHNSGGKLSHGLEAKLFRLQRGKCPCCKKPLGNDYHIDHKLPIALGGSNDDGNMQLLRKTCNLQKSAAHPIEFMRQRGFLL